MSALVTGASGFVGRALCARLAKDGYPFSVAVRSPGVRVDGATAHHVVGALGASTDWSPALHGVDTIFHLAGRAHVMQEDTGADTARAYRTVSVDATEALVRAAERAGAGRLVFVSTVKVNGEGGPGVLKETDAPAPADDYARSKLEAEAIVRQSDIVRSTIVRPPLVYGPKVRANFLSLLTAVHRGLPLPLGAVHNRRSLVFVDNLVDALLHLAQCEVAAGETYFVSDGRAISTTELILEMSRALGRSPRLVPVPASWLSVAGRLVGKGAAVSRLTDSFEVDTSKLRATGWTPPHSLREGLAATAHWYLHAAKEGRAA